MKKWQAACIHFFLWSLWSCSSPDTQEPAPQSVKYKVEARTEVNKREIVSQAREYLGLAAVPLTALLKYNVERYVIKYRTIDVKGDTIMASGVLFIPKSSNKTFPLLAIHHGTDFDQGTAISDFGGSTEAVMGVTFCSAGTIVAMPDYVGYGYSKSMAHPYETRKGLDQSNVDFLLAVKDYLESEKKNFNGNLMLTGYSEGGYANMSVHKLLEEKYPNAYKIVGSSCGAGAYDKTNTVKFFYGK